jgi:hypothetical protein
MPLSPYLCPLTTPSCSDKQIKCQFYGDLRSFCQTSLLGENKGRLCRARRYYGRAVMAEFVTDAAAHTDRRARRRETTTRRPGPTAVFDMVPPS